MLLSTTSRENVLKNIGGKIGSFSIGANGNCWLGLSTTTPSNTGTNFTEPSAAHNYERVNISALLGTPTTSGDVTSIANSEGDINFNTAADTSDPSAVTGGDWGTLVAIGLFTSKTGGEPYAWGMLENSVTVNTHGTVWFYKGYFKMSITEAT